MSIFKKIGQAIQSLLAAVQKLVYYIAAPIARIFGPTDDEYPNTGIQPFEGEMPDKNNKEAW